LDKVISIEPLDGSRQDDPRHFPRYYASIRGELLHGSLKYLSECYCEIRDESVSLTFRPVNVGIAHN
jgi:hypothetical protein